MTSNANSVAVIEEAFEALEKLEEACNAIIERPLEPTLPHKLKVIRYTLDDLMKAAQEHHIDQYLPKGQQPCPHAPADGLHSSPSGSAPSPSPS